MPRSVEDLREELQLEARANEFNILSLLWLGSSWKMIGCGAFRRMRNNQTSAFGAWILTARTASAQDLISSGWVVSLVGLTRVESESAKT